MHNIVTGILMNAGEKLKLIHEFMPLVVIHKINIHEDLISCQKSHGYFSIAWNSKLRGKINSNSILTADKIMWLAGKQGQGLMNFIFRQINKAVKTGQQSVDLSYSSDKNMWQFDGYSKIEIITIDQFKEVLAAKGYKSKIASGDQDKITVYW